MSIIVTDSGFSADDWTGRIAPLDQITAEHAALELPPDADPATLRPLLPTLRMIRIGFANFADGRGFTLARRLRLMGYRGRLRARGHVLPDQYAMARRAGFDEIEIDDALAQRFTEPQWLFRNNWHTNNYQARLRG